MKQFVFVLVAVISFAVAAEEKQKCANFRGVFKIDSAGCKVIDDIHKKIYYDSPFTKIEIEAADDGPPRFWFSLQPVTVDPPHWGTGRDYYQADGYAHDVKGDQMVLYRATCDSKKIEIHRNIYVWGHRLGRTIQLVWNGANSYTLEQWFLLGSDMWNRSCPLTRIR